MIYMIKKITSLSILIFSTIFCFSENLVPTEFYYANGMWEPTPYWPIRRIVCVFDTAVGIKEGATLRITHGSDTVLTSPLVVSEHPECMFKKGMVYAVYGDEKGLILPKGKDYRVVIDPGLIYSLEEENKTNPMLTLDISIPSHLPFFGGTSPKNDKPLKRAWSIGVTFSAETAEIGEPEAYISRNGVPVRHYPLSVGWDWGIGNANVMFSEKLRFEEGVQYSLTIPAGCVSAAYRPDITNEEITVKFIGGWKEEIPAPVPYHWEMGPDEFMTARFYFNKEVTLLPVGSVKIKGNRSGIVREGTLALEKEGDGSILTASFGGVWPEEAEDYTAVMDEATVVFSSGDIMVNRELQFNLGYSGVKQIEKDKISMTVSDSEIFIRNLHPGENVRIVSSDGRELKSVMITNDSISISVPGAGIYLVSVGDRTEKIVVREL